MTQRNVDTPLQIQTNLNHTYKLCRPFLPPDRTSAQSASPKPLQATPSRGQLLRRHVHAAAVEARLPDEAVADGLDVALVHDIVEAEVEAAEHTRQHDVQLGVGDAV